MNKSAPARDARRRTYVSRRPPDLDRWGRDGHRTLPCSPRRTAKASLTTPGLLPSYSTPSTRAMPAARYTKSHTGLKSCNFPPRTVVRAAAYESRPHLFNCDRQFGNVNRPGQVRLGMSSRPVNIFSTGAMRSVGRNGRLCCPSQTR